jgi:hypothetical protein
MKATESVVDDVVAAERYKKSSMGVLLLLPLLLLRELFVTIPRHDDDDERKRKKKTKKKYRLGIALVSLWVYIEVSQNQTPPHHTPKKMRLEVCDEYVSGFVVFFFNAVVVVGCVCVCCVCLTGVLCFVLCVGHVEDRSRSSACVSAPTSFFGSGTRTGSELHSLHTAAHWIYVDDRGVPARQNVGASKPWERAYDVRKQLLHSFVTVTVSRT